MNDEEMMSDIRQTLAFVTDNINNLTPLHFNAAKRKRIKEHITIWRWYLSHGYFEPPNEALNADKPPISWLYSLLVEPRAVKYLITLLAAPGVTDSSDLRNGADILMLKLSRIASYASQQPIPATFYLPDGDPKKTDQYGVLWGKSKAKAAVKYRKRLRQEKRDKESILPKPKPIMSEKERKAKTKAYLQHKNAQRKAEREKREALKSESLEKYRLEQWSGKNGNQA